jgi:hypothetical protein
MDVQLTNAASISTLVLTALMLIGLLFFIKASVKDRITSIRLYADLSEIELAQALNQYFAARAYRIVGVKQDSQQVVMEGFVLPSPFLTIFLGILAGIGGLSLGLVVASLTSVVPLEISWLGIFLGPIASWFYWSKAGRLEQVQLKIDAILSGDSPQSVAALVGHRDELELLRQQMPTLREEA